MTKDYPLSWPKNWPRTDSYARKLSNPFKVSQAVAVSEMEDEIERLGGTDIVLTTNQRRGENPEDPGAAVYFTREGKDVCVPCDSYYHLMANIRAIGLTLAAIRSIERYGTGQMVDAAFAGFTALPAPGITTQTPGDILGLPALATRSQIDAAYKAKAKLYHPDNPETGNEHMFKLVRSAYEALIQETKQ